MGLEWDAEWPDGLATSLEPWYEDGVNVLCIDGWEATLTDIVPGKSRPGDASIVQSATTGRRYEVTVKELQSGRNEWNELIVTSVKLELRDVTAEGR